MDVFTVCKPVGTYSYGEDYAMVVVAEDELHAERRARQSSYDFKKGPLDVKKVSLDVETVVLKANVGG